MVRGDKAVDNEVTKPTGSEEGEEIDRIMKEIEDLEKRMDEDAPQAEADGSDTKDEETSEGGKVVALRPEVSDTMAETDAVPASDEPLMHESQGTGDGGLSMKIGGCTEVSLEFTRAGVTVSLSCTDDGLCITTDAGAEFRLPFKRTA
jgi:hypothetical protein